MFHFGYGDETGVGAVSFVLSFESSGWKQCAASSAAQAALECKVYFCLSGDFRPGCATGLRENCVTDAKWFEITIFFYIHTLLS